MPCPFPTLFRVQNLQLGSEWHTICSGLVPGALWRGFCRPQDSSQGLRGPVPFQDTLLETWSTVWLTGLPTNPWSLQNALSCMVVIKSCQGKGSCIQWSTDFQDGQKSTASAHRLWKMDVEVFPCTVNLCAVRSLKFTVDSFQNQRITAQGGVDVLYFCHVCTPDHESGACIFEEKLKSCTCSVHDGVPWIPLINWYHQFSRSRCYLLPCLAIHTLVSCQHFRMPRMSDSGPCRELAPARRRVKAKPRSLSPTADPSMERSVSPPPKQWQQARGNGRKSGNQCVEDLRRHTLTAWKCHVYYSFVSQMSKVLRSRSWEGHRHI